MLKQDFHDERSLPLSTWPPYVSQPPKEITEIWRPERPRRRYCILVLRSSVGERSEDITIAVMLRTLAVIAIGDAYSSAVVVAMPMQL